MWPVADLTEVGVSGGPCWCAVAPRGFMEVRASAFLLRLPVSYTGEKLSAKVLVAAMLWAEEQLPEGPWSLGSVPGLCSEVPVHSLPFHVQLRLHLAMASSWNEPLPPDSLWNQL